MCDGLIWLLSEVFQLSFLGLVISISIFSISVIDVKYYRGVLCFVIFTRKVEPNCMIIMKICRLVQRKFVKNTLFLIHDIHSLMTLI